jgi:hypothetical protein
MHRSRLSSVIIDCQVDDLDSAASFWSQALGKPIDRAPNDESNYRYLTSRKEEPLVLLQQVNHPSRVHLDIETDDMDAEVKRLESLGAKRVEFVKRWWVMQAPTRQRFCVVRPQRGPLDSSANEWP